MLLELLLYVVDEHHLLSLGIHAQFLHPWVLSFLIVVVLIRYIVSAFFCSPLTILLNELDDVFVVDFWNLGLQLIFLSFAWVSDGCF